MFGQDGLIWAGIIVACCFVLWGLTCLGTAIARACQRIIQEEERQRRQDQQLRYTEPSLDDHRGLP